MPGGPRRTPRIVRSAHVAPPVLSSFANDPSGHRYAPLGATVPTLPALEQPSPPKHFPFPNTPMEDDLFFEFLMSFFSIMSCGLQYLHLYRSVWWLPHSYTKHALNFYLIDIYLVIFIVVILSRRLIYILGCKVIDKIVSEQMAEAIYHYFRTFFFGVLCGLLSICAYFVMQNHPVVNILYLCYPILVYLILFGFDVYPFFELVNWTPNSPPPLHACSSNPSDNRKEVENLKGNFNNRMKQILFSAILNAYYAGFIPCCFAQSALHYDVYWASQHVIFVFVSGFIGLSLHILSLRYCDILHRSALHLGTWEKLETGRTMLLVNNVWKDDMLWPCGALVRHGRDIWRAQGDCNTGEPGNVGHVRFFLIFESPSHMTLGTKLVIHFFMVSYQLFLLVKTTYWYNLISIWFLLFFNYYIMYKLVRDYLVSTKIYREEKEMHKKMNMH